MASPSSNTAPQPDIPPPHTGPSPPSCWDELASSLNAVKSLENFSSIKAYPRPANPVIQVDEYVIALPLTDDGAERIKQVSRHFNATDETQVLTDTSNKNRWDLDAGNFNQLNPDWPSFLKEIMDDALKSLGITGSVYPEPYKLQMCEQDGSYQWRNKTREGVGLAAMLAICLPSMHQGGTIRVRYGGKRHIFNTGESSMFTTRALAWHPNAIYEEEKVVSGRRLMLFYRIIDESAIPNSPINTSQPADIVSCALHRCVQQAPNFSAKLYLLDYHYPDAELSSARLKGHDRAVVDALHELCSLHGLYCLLGRLRKQRTMLGDSVTESDTKEHNFSVELLNVADGEEIAKNIVFTQDQLLGDPYRARRIADIPRPFRCLEFRKTAAIIFPKIQLASYLYPPQNSNFPNIIQMVIQDIDDGNSTDGYPGDSLRVLGEIVDSGEFPKLPPEVYSRIIEWAWVKKYAGLFAKIVSSEMGSGVSAESMSTVAQIINRDISENADTISIEWDVYFDGIFCHTQDFKNITLNLEIVQDKIRDGVKLSFASWKRSVQQHMFRNKFSLSLEDVDYFLHSVMPAKEYPEWILNCLVPALRLPDRRVLLRESICLLLDRKQNENLINAKEIANSIILCMYQKAALETSDFDGGAYSSSLSKGFRDLISGCLHSGLGTAAIRLLDASWTNIVSRHGCIDASPLMEYKDNIKEFLHDLGRLLQDCTFPHIYSTRETFKLLVRRYIYATAPSYPENPPGWTRKKRGCGCKTCLELDEFLQSEKLFKKEFMVENVSHLKSRLPPGVFRCVHRPTAQAEPFLVYSLYKIKGKEFEHELEVYNEKLLEFEKSFEPLRNDYMEGLFGEADYRELIMLEKVKNSEGNKQRKAVAAVEERKRKAEETSDDDDKPAKKMTSKA
ncbi:hypothetical protein F4859DRAFT_513714 [Xylaria cf. heliscus]|nr:hypothetical protein F4859DRAFT_513714 [Xylaria cf. heliscus]